MAIWRAYCGVMPTTSQFSALGTTTSLKTLLQLKAANSLLMKVKKWGISFDGSAGAQGVQCELLETGTVFGTVTAFAAADLMAIDAAALLGTSTNFLSVGTSASGYNCSAEGSIAATRIFDAPISQPTGPYVWEYSLGNEPVVNAGCALRVRVKAPSAYNAIAWVEVEV